MKGVILAGGSGTRLQPITYTTQKQLVPIANKPVIEHVIEDLRSVGITEIGIVIGGDFPEDVKEFLGHGEDFGVEITYIMQGEPLGLAHAVGCARDFIGDDSFVVYFGDTILGEDITKTLVESFDPESHDAGLVLKRVEDPSRFGVVDIHDGEITRILEKPEDPPSNLAYVGALAFTPAVFRYIEEQEPSWRGELELTQVIHNMAAGRSTVNWDVVDGLWKDVGTPDDVIETNRVLLEEIEQENRGKIAEGAEITGPVKLGDGSVVEASATINGPVVIGENTTIGKGAHIDPYTSIGDQCFIEDTHLTSSVVMEGAEIRGERAIENSIIGKEVTVEGGDGDSSRQYIIGRDSVLTEGE